MDDRAERAVLSTALAVSVLAAATAHGTAQAQVSGPADVFALPLLKRATTITFNSSESYDNNVARSSEALAALRGIRREDEVFSPNVDANIVRAYGVTDVYLTGTGGYEFYNHDHVLNRQNVTLLAGAFRQFNRCQVQPIGGFASGQADLDEFRTFTRENIKDTRNLYTIGLKSSCRLAAHLLPTVSVKRSDSNNSQAVEKLTDYRATTIDAGLAYIRGVGDQASLYLESQNTNFPDRPEIYGGTSGFQDYSGGVSFQKPLGAKLKLAASLGYISVTSDGPEFQTDTSFSGPAYSAQLHYTSLNRLRASLSAYRQITPSTLVGSTYSVDDYIVGQVDYNANSSYIISFGYSNLHREYKGAVPLLGTSDVYDLERIQSVYSDVSYNLSRRLSVKFDARWEQRRANIGLYNYDDGRFTISFGATF